MVKPIFSSMTMNHAYGTSLDYRDCSGDGVHAGHYQVASIPPADAYKQLPITPSPSTSTNPSLTQTHTPSPGLSSFTSPNDVAQDPNSNLPSYFDATNHSQHRDAVTFTPNVTHPSSSIDIAIPERALSELDLTPQSITDHATPSSPPPTDGNSSSPPTTLTLPVAIPQTLAGRGQPFDRVWAPALEAQGITQTDFLPFLDGLNRVASANTPLQALQAGGFVVGLIPFSWAQYAGYGIGAAADAGIAAVSKTRVSMYLKRANAQLFTGRGLRCRIVDCTEIRTVLRIPAARPLVLAPTRETMGSTGRQRMLAAVRPYAAPVTAHVPAPAKPPSKLAKLSARQLAYKERRREEKLAAQRNRISRQGRGGSAHDSLYAKEMGQAMKLKWLIIEPLDHISTILRGC